MPMGTGGKPDQVAAPLPGTRSPIDVDTCRVGEYAGAVKAVARWGRTMAVRAKDLQAIARQSHFRLPRGTAAGLSGAGGRVPCPLRPARRAGGAAAGAALSPRRRRSPRSKENPWGPGRCGSASGAPHGPLAGRTLAVKDNIAVAGAPMRNGPVLLDSYVPTRTPGWSSGCWTPVPSSWARRSARAVLLRGSHSHTAGWSRGARCRR
jgi:hypothetical protein